MSDWQNFLKGKRVTVMGLGLLGRGINDVKFLSKYCAEVLVTDLKTPVELSFALEEIKDCQNIQLVLGEHRLEDFENRDFILKAAGVPIDSPFIAHAKSFNTPVYMDEALFVKLAPGIFTIGVTGTRGKTTTTMMIEKILSDAGKPLLLGGNIRGTATLPLLESFKSGDIVLMELSSWQLQGFGDLGMSRIGKKPFQIPANCEASLHANVLTVKGPKGTLSLTHTLDVSITITDGQILVEKKGSSLQALAMWGTMAKLVKNLFEGVTTGFSRALELNGVGYRMTSAGKKLTLALGFSHPVVMEVPDGLEVKIENNVLANSWPQTRIS
jgi:ribosomal protein L6P/L9E